MRKTINSDIFGTKCADTDLFICSFYFNTVAFVYICHHHRHEYGTDSVSNLLMTWCVVTGVCVRARTTVAVIHWTSLRTAAAGGSEQVLTDAEFVWLYYGSVWVGGLRVMSSPDDADVTGNYFLFPQRRRLSSCLGVREHPLVELLTSCPAELLSVSNHQHFKVKPQSWFYKRH